MQSFRARPGYFVPNRSREAFRRGKDFGHDNNTEYHSYRGSLIDVASKGCLRLIDDKVVARPCVRIMYFCLELLSVVSSP